jgi:hypothetical protein
MKYTPCSFHLIRVNALLMNELSMRVKEATCKSYTLSFALRRERERERESESERERDGNKCGLILFYNCGFPSDPTK